MIKYLALTTISLIIFVGCAKRGAPPGGPEDKSPPQILSTIPTDGDTLVPLDTKIKVSFDEPIKSNENSVMIYPPIENSFVRFRKNYFELQHRTPLKKNTTYSLILTPIFSDRHGNRIGKTMEIAFSTGNKMDTSRVGGYVLDGETFSTADGVVVAAYSDSVMSSPPLKITFSAEDGSFIIRNLPHGKIWLFAGIGAGNEMNWRQAEKIAISDGAISLPTKEKKFLVLAANDSTPPKIISTSAPDSFTIRIKLSERTIIDSVCATLGKNIWLDPADSTSILARQKDIVQGKSFTIKICDFAYNCTTKTITVPEDAGNDTLPPEPLFRRKETILPFETPKLVFSEPFHSKIFAEIDGKIIEIDTNRTAPNTMEILFPSDLSAGEKVLVILDSLCDDFGNCTSDTISFTKSKEKFGDILVSGISKCQNPLIFLRTMNGKNIRLGGEKNKFSATVPGGKYMLWQICDENGDGRWTAGKFSPGNFKYSEVMRVFEDTVYIRPGWETEVKW
ncbi:Ig-like domain-containing protein [bacterium]|nr:Ig-like domain-containing protein [bacterium]